MSDILLLIGRSLRNALRQPATIIPNIAISVFFLFVYNSGLNSVAQLPGFQGHVPRLHPAGEHRVGGGRRRRSGRADAHQGHRQRLLHQAAAHADAAPGGHLGTDDRERHHPHGAGGPRDAAGAGDGTQGRGRPGRLPARRRRCAFLWGMAFAGYAAFMALKTKNAAAAQAATFAFFPLIFLSYTFVPKQYVTAGWLKVAATINPTTYVFDSMRSLLNIGWSASSLVVGFAVTFGFATLTGILALWAARGATKLAFCSRTRAGRQRLIGRRTGLRRPRTARPVDSGYERGARNSRRSTRRAPSPSCASATSATSSSRRASRCSATASRRSRSPSRCSASPARPPTSASCSPPRACRWRRWLWSAACGRTGCRAPP